MNKVEFLYSRFCRFNNVRIPRINLLNKNSDVTPDGKYLALMKDEKKHFSATLGTLSGGRVGITGIGISNLKSAITIAIRYILCTLTIWHLNKSKGINFWLFLWKYHSCKKALYLLEILVLQ